MCTNCQWPGATSTHTAEVQNFAQIVWESTTPRGRGAASQRALVAETLTGSVLQARSIASIDGQYIVVQSL
jgi:hypothetical protein